MPRWIRSFWAEGDLTSLWEIADDGWVSRSIELVGPELAVQAAASLDEVLAARDSGGIQAVQAYEARYGVAPEKPIDDWDFPYEDVGEAEFEVAWTEARRGLEESA